MLSLDDVLRWDVTGVDRVADRLARRRKLLVDGQVDLDAGRPPSSWLHAAADAAHQRHRLLDTRLLDLTAEVAAVVATLDVVLPTMRRTQTELRAQLDLARRHGLHVDRVTLAVSPIARPVDGVDADRLRVLAAEIETELHRALASARAVDSDIADVLARAVSGEVDGGHGTLAEAAQQVPHLDGAYPEAVAAARERAGLDASSLVEALVIPDEDAWQDGTRQLERISDLVRSGERLGAGEAAYLRTWLDTLGAYGLATLPARVVDLLPHGGTEVERARLLDAHLAPVADAILHLSNPAVHQADAGVVAPVHPTDVPPFSRVPPAGLPEAVRDLIGTRLGAGLSDLGVVHDGQDPARPGAGQSNFDQVAGYDRLRGWATLLASASEGVAGGPDLSVSLAEQALDAKQALNRIAETAEATPADDDGGQVGGWVHAVLDEARFDDAPMSDLLAVAARNEDGSAAVLLEAASRRSLLMLNWDHPHGAVELVAAGTARDATGAEGSVIRAEAAQAVMLDVARDPARWHELTTEPMSDAIVDVGITWRDTFGGHPAVTVDRVLPEMVDALDRQVGPWVQLEAGERRQFLHFVVSAGDVDAARFHAALIDHGNSQVSDALAGDDTQHLRNALWWAAEADGSMSAAYIDVLADQHEDELDRRVVDVIASNREIAAHKTNAFVASGVTRTAAAEIPGVGIFLSAGLDAGTRPLIEGIFEAAPVPDYDTVKAQFREEQLQAAIDRQQAVQDHRFVNLFAERYPADSELPELFEDGRLRGLDDFLDSERKARDLRTLAGHVVDAWNRDHVNRLDFDTEYSARVRELIGWAGADNDRHDPALDDAAARSYLYGPLAEYAGDSSRTNPDHPESGAWELRHREIGRPQ